MTFVLLWPFKIVYTILSTLRIFSFLGFSVGILLGLTAGYFLFIYSLSAEVRDPVITPIDQLNEKALKRLLPEIPAWVQNPDYDKLDWLNTFLRALWPYLDKAVCETVKQQVKPLIAQSKPGSIESIEFEEMTLGSLPPVFTGIKVYDTADNEMILEPILKWAGNPNIVVAVKAFGLKATAQLVDVSMALTARATFKPLVNVFPCFTKITVCLMQKPQIDFGLKLLGGDLMAIPGLYQFVQDAIKDVVASMMLWPKTYEVYKIDDLSAQKRPIGFIFFKVIEAKGLKNTERIGVSDPYVKLTLGQGPLGTKKTKVVNNSLDPVWNEVVRLQVRDLQVEVLELELRDFDKVGAHTKMGLAKIPLKDHKLEHDKTVDLGWIPLMKNFDPKDPSNQKDRGSIHLEATFQQFEQNEDMPGADGDDEHGPGGAAATQAVERMRQQAGVKPGEAPPNSGGVLVVCIHTGEDLEGKHGSNPISMIMDKVVKKQSDPEFEETFQFELPQEPKDEVLHIEVWSKNTGLTHYVSAKEMIGNVDIPLNDVVNNKRINEIYQLTESRNGKLKVELEWLPL
eukprot:SM000224S07113  [mRNA]  locus=s224:208503:212456:- [translate_table: standard]